MSIKFTQDLLKKNLIYFYAHFLRMDFMNNSERLSLKSQRTTKKKKLEKKTTTKLYLPLGGELTSDSEDRRVRISGSGVIRFGDIEWRPVTVGVSCC